MPDYTGVSGTLSLEPGQSGASFVVNLIDDESLENTEQFGIELSNINGGAEFGDKTKAVVNIIDNEALNVPSGDLDVTFRLGTGADGIINTLEILPDGRVLIGGGFTVFNGIPVPNLTRLLPDGNVDMSFVPGQGPNGHIQDIVELSSGFLLAVGDFTTYNGNNLKHIVRLNVDGALDSTFDAGAGTDGSIQVAIEDSEGRILLGGNFTSYNGFPSSGLVRINGNGSIDQSFDVGSGVNGTVESIVLDWEDGIILSGSFDSYNGIQVPGIVRLDETGSVDLGFLEALPKIEGKVSSSLIQEDGRILVGGDMLITVQSDEGDREYINIIRLNRDGSVDLTFQPISSIAGSGNKIDGIVRTIVVQPDGRIILGGDFREFGGLVRSGLLRLDHNGELDNSINFGLGANGSVRSIAVQNDFRIVIVGDFTSFNGVDARGIARIYGGLDYNPGEIRFEKPSYIVNENGVSDAIYIIREGGVSSQGSFKIKTSSITAVDGQDYLGLKDISVVFEAGVVFKELLLAYIPSDIDFESVKNQSESGLPILNIVNDQKAEDPVLINLELIDFDGAKAGDQTISQVSLISDDSVVQIVPGDLVFAESLSEGAIGLEIRREGGVENAISVDFNTFDGTAVSSGLNPDYVESYGTIHFEAGEFSRLIRIPVIDDTHQEGVETLYLRMSNAKPSSSAHLGGDSVVQLQIQDGDRDSLRSTISLKASEFRAYESSGEVEIRVVREGDLSREAIASFSTTDQTAIEGADYDGSMGHVFFKQGSSEEVIRLAINDDVHAEGDESFEINLLNSQGASIGELETASVVIVDAEAGTLIFSAWNDETDWINDSGENKLAWDGVQITDEDNELDIDWNLRDYQYFVSEKESMVPYDSAKENSLSQMTTAPWYWGSDTKISADLFQKVKDQTHRIGGSHLGAPITITRVRGSTGRLAVDYSTSDGSAKVGEHYSHVDGVIYFDDHEMSKTIIVPIIAGGEFVDKVIDQATGKVVNVTVPSVDFKLRLFNARVAEGEPEHLKPYLADQAGNLQDDITATININRQWLSELRPRTPDQETDDVGFQFHRAKFRVKESQGSVRIWINRGSISEPQNGVEALGSYAGTATVSYAVGPNFVRASGDSPRPIKNWPEDGLIPYNFYGTRRFVNAQGDTDPPFEDELFPNFNQPWESPVPKLDLEPGSDYASPGLDFQPITGQLSFGPGVTGLAIDIPILNDDIVEFNEDFFVFLYNPTPDVRPAGSGDTGEGGGWAYVGNDRMAWLNGGTAAGQYYCKVTILSDDDFGAEQPAGAVNRNFNPDYQSFTQPPLNSAPGANDDVHAVAIQPVVNWQDEVEQKIIIGGDFNAYNTVPRGKIARLNPDGSLDRWFNIGSGADDFINTVLVRSDSKILIGGGFTSYNGTVRYSLAQLENNGALDTTFDVGSGADGAVRAMAFVGPAQSLGVTDKRAVIIAGDFTTFNGVKSTRVARVLSTGELDESLFMREGPNGPVYSVAVQEDGKIIIGGDFTMYDEYRRGNVTRINVDGTLDEKFEAIIGADDTVHSVFLQPDGKILLGGSFKAINAVPRNGIARLNADGSVDESFDPGSGFDAPVLDVSATGTLIEWPVGDDGDTVTLFRNVRVYAGGLFTHFSGTRRMGVARLYGNGTLDTTFMDTAYNQFAGLHKEGVSSPANHVGSLVVDENGDVIIGGSFDSVGGGFTRDDVRNQLNVAKLVGGGTPGPGNIELANDDYAVDENTGELFVLLNRRNGSLGAALANVGLPLSRIGSGIATAADDYEKTLTTVVWPSLYRKDTDSALNGGGWMRSDAHFGFNNEPTITSTGNEWPTVENNLTLKIHEDRIVEGNEKLIVKLSYPRSSLYLGGEKIAIGTALGRNHATISIIDNDFSHGVIKFSQQQLFIDENQAKAVVLVERIKGSVGEVSVDYDVRQINHDELMANDLSDDAVAVATGVLADFIPAKNTLTFGPGETVKQIEINIINDIRSEIDEALALTLFNPKGGAVIDGPFGVGSSIITIIDDDYSSGKIEFVSGDNHFMENEGKAVLSVRRIGGSVGAVSVEFMVQEATAREGEDYMYESQLLEWADGDTANKHIQIELLDDKFVDQDRHFSIVITSAVASQNRDVVIGRNKTDVTIREDDSLGSISFAKSNHSVNENSGQFIVNVIRSAGYNESVSIDYEVASGSALEALDFVEQKGTLNFHEGQKSAFFSVAVMDDKLLEGHETIGLILSNPKPLREGQSLLPILGTPNMATLTIVDDEASNEPAGLIDSSFVTVGGSDDSVQVLEMQGDSKILIGGGFNFVNGLVRNGLARLNSDGNIDTTFQIGSGFDGVVRSLAIQPDQRIIAVGYFTQFDGVNRNGIVRLNQDGGIDETFNPGGGADNPIQDVLIQDDGRIIIVGDFTSFNGVALNRIARLHNDGRVDETFNVGSGANFSIHDVSQTVDGGIVLVGDFNNFNGYQSMGIVVLHQNGEIDESFDSGIGFDASARSIVVQDDGKILVGGFFSNYNGDDITRLVRLNPDGSRDPDFDCGSGADGSIYTLALQSDGKIFVGGSFGEFNGLKRNAICRLNPDGSVDPTINFGTGPNGSVLAIYPKADSKILIGGGFTKYNDIDREHFVQIYGGILDGSGTMQFVSPTFMVGESGTNAVVRVIRNGGLRGEIKAKFNTLLSVSSHPAVPGLDFEMVDSEVSFRQGEIFHSIEIPIINDDEVEVEEDVDLRLSEFSGDSEGLQSNARLLIASDDSFISFVADQYSVAENSQFGYANILIERIGDVSKMAEVTFMTKTNGTALATLDFQMISNAVTFLEGDASRSVEVPIVDDSVVEGYESVTLLLTNAVGNATLDRRVSNLNIVDDDFAPGQFYLENAISRVHENAGFATLTVMRTNGYTGIVEIEYAVSDLTAINGEDYVAINGKLVFSDAEDKKTFDIPIIDDKEEEGAEAFRVRLFNVTGNGSLRQPSYGTIVIIDDELQALPGPKGIGADGPVYSVTITDQDFVYLGGEFQAYNGAPAPRLLRLLPDGSRDAQFIVKEEINNTVFDLEVTDDGKVWIGGLFGEFGDSGHSYLAALNEDGSIDSSFDSSGQIKGPVFEIVESKEKFLVGGEFGIKRFSRQGVGDDDFHSPKFDGSVYAIDVQADGKILVGGTFSTVDGHPFSRITRLKSSGVVDETFNVGTGANGNINTVMALADGGIVLGGSFISIDGYSARRFAKLLPDGSLNREFTIGDGFNGTVNDIFLRADGRFLIGGSFTRYDDSKQDYVVLLENDGTPTRDNFDKLNLNNTVYSLSEKAGGLMVLGGSFTQVKDLGYNYLALAEGISAMTPASLTIQQSVDGISLNIVGEIGEIYVLEISDDLVTWLKLSDAIIPESGSQKIDLGPSSSNRYFRAVYRE